MREPLHVFFGLRGRIDTGADGHSSPLYSVLAPHTVQTSPSSWEAEVALPLGTAVSADVLTYKYAIRTADGNLMLEHGESRLLSIPDSSNGSSEAGRGGPRDGAGMLAVGSGGSSMQQSEDGFGDPSPAVVVKVGG